MNSTWSRFNPIDPSAKQKETFHANILQEFLRTNGFYSSRNINISENSSETTTNENHLTEKEVKNEIQEIHVEMTSQSVTRLQGENISENSGVLRVYSKTTLKGKKLNENKSLKEEKLEMPSRINEAPEVDDKLRSSYWWTEEGSVSSDKKDKDQFPVREIKKTEDRIIADGLFSYPPEVVEIYFSNKDTEPSMRTLPKEEDECRASNSGESILGCLFSGMNSRIIDEETCSVRNVQKIEESGSLDTDKFVEPIREECLNEIENSINPEINEKEDVETKDLLRSDVKKEERSAEELNLQNLCGKNEDSNVIQTEIVESNEISVEPNERKSSKSTLTSEESGDSKYSKSDLSSLENVTILQNEEKLNCKEENSNVDSSEENKTKKMIEKREDKKDDFNTNADKDILQKEEENFQDSSNEMMRIQIEDPKTGMITQKTTQIIDDYKDMNICKMLASIHEQLTHDLQRMKYIETKLIGTVSIDSINHTMTLQLLDKTVARCKSYLHGSNNSQKAELEIKKILMKHGIKLMMAVNKNKAALDKQEERLNQVQFKPLKNSRYNITMLMEIKLSLNYWKEEIVCLIELISDLVKMVIINNEEKENVKNLQKYKTTHHRTANYVPTHDTKSKSGSVRSKIRKINLFKKESTVETQISLASNAKSSVKPLSNSVNRERGKIHNDGQIGDTKTTERGRIAKESSQSKNRVISTQQPVWKPGGIVKIPSSNSATTLQKARSNVKEKINLFAEHTRASNVSKKKITSDVSSVRSMFNPRIVGKRSNTSLRVSPRMKPKGGTVRASSRNFNEFMRQIPGYPNSKYGDSRSLHDEARPRNFKESKPFGTLKETIEPPKMYEKEEMNPRNIINLYRLPVAFEQPSKSILIKKEKEEIPINKEEPTRDVNSSRYIRNHLNPSNMIDANHQTVDQISDSLFNPEEALDLSKHVSRKFENHIDANGFPNIVSIANCVEDFSSNYNCTTRIEVSSRYQSSYNTVSSSSTQNQAKKVNDRLSSSIRNEENQTDTLINEKQKIKPNSHAVSLSMLKEFLCEQGIGADLVNRAEQELKVKQKTRRHSKKKSISFADMLFSVEDDQPLDNVLKDENLGYMLEKQEENIIINEKNSENSESHEEENVINSKKNLMYPEIHEEEDVINSGKSLKYTENVNYEKNLSDAENPEEDNSNSENNLKRPENSKENESNLPSKHTEDYKTNIAKCPPQPETKDASSGTEYNTNNASSQTNFQNESRQRLQIVPKDLRMVETQTETKQEERVRNLTNEVRNVSSMTETLPVRDSSTETTNVSCASKSVATEQIDYIFSKNFNKNLKEAFSNVSNEDNKNSSKSCRNVFRQLLNQMKENECSSCERNDASKELRFVESNASTLCTSSSSSSSESLKNNEETTKEANTSPIRSVSSETMAAFHVTAIRIRNIYKAIDIYKRKLKEKQKKAEKGSTEKRLKICEGRPTYVTKSSSVDTIFTKKDNGKNGAIQMYEALRRAEVESIFTNESPDEDFESIQSSSSTTWSYKTTAGKVELKLSGKLSDTIVLRDVKSLMEFLIQKTEDSTMEKKVSVRKISNNTCTRLQDNETVKFSIFSRENVLPLIYGVMCLIVFCCLRFTITCDVVS
nr:uncharacterized protein PF11_0213-like [Osmia lignaria]